MLKNKAVIKKSGLALLSCLLIGVFVVLNQIILVDAASEKYIYNANNKRDPFLALVTPEGMVVKIETEEDKNKEIELDGIIYDGSGVSFAIVNGEVVKVGDSVGAYQVLKIEKSKVVFIKDGLTKEVELTEEESK